jgi:LysR family transcriptional activator of mexEF-oprN operon
MVIIAKGDIVLQLRFDMNLMVVLNALFEERSVTRAGERLGRTQSAISNSLKKLREALDDPLFIRSSDGLVPTPRAMALENSVRDIVNIARTCLANSAVFDPSTAKARFRIGAPDRLSLPVLLPFMRKLRSLAPGVSVNLRTTDREQALDLLETDAIDLAVGWFDHPPPRLNSTLVFQENLVCVCRKDHPIAQSPRGAKLAEILAFPHLVVSSAGDGKAAFDSILQRIGEKRHAAISVTNFTMVPHILNDSNLIGIFTQRIADYIAKEFGLKTVPIPFEVEQLSHFLVWHKRFDTDPGHVWIRDQIAIACS